MNITVWKVVFRVARHKLSQPLAIWDHYRKRYNKDTIGKSVGNSKHHVNSACGWTQPASGWVSRVSVKQFTLHGTTAHSEMMTAVIYNKRARCPLLQHGTMKYFKATFLRVKIVVNAVTNVLEPDSVFSADSAGSDELHKRTILVASTC